MTAARQTPLTSRISIAFKADIRPGYEGELDGEPDRPERATEGLAAGR